MKYCPYCGRLLEDDMHFCPDCGRSYTDTVNTDSELKSNIGSKSVVKKKWLIPVCVVFAVALFGIIYYIPILHVSNGKFTAAKKALTIPALYEERLKDYIQAGTDLETENYGAAVEAFRNLTGYRQADEYYQEARYLQAHNLKDPLAAYNAIKELANSGYEPAKAEVSEFQSALYSTMCSNYRSGRYAAVKTMCVALDGYQESDKYALLASIKSGDSTLKYNGKNYSYSTIVPVLLGMKNFEDAFDLILSTPTITRAYLTGTWKTKDKKFYFKIDEDGDASFNLSWYDGKGNYYTIYNGDYITFKKTYDEKGAIKQLTITPVSQDEIKIYAYRNKKTYTMYRE